MKPTAVRLISCLVPATTRGPKTRPQKTSRAILERRPTLLTSAMWLARPTLAAAGPNIDPTARAKGSAPQAVLFPFQRPSVPLRHGLQLELISAQRNAANPVLRPGGTGAPDSESMSYYGTVLQVGDELRRGYLGRGNPEHGPLRGRWSSYCEVRNPM